MTTISMSVDTLEFVDKRAGNDKFYRVYLIPSLGIAYCQNGSQRHGRDGGTFRTWTLDEGKRKLDEKIRKGYTRVESANHQVDIPKEKYDQMRGRGDKVAGAFLEGLYQASLRLWSTTNTQIPSRPTSSPARRPVSAPSSSQPATGTTVNVGVIENLSEKLLAAISEAATNPVSALVAYAEINELVEELEADVRKVKSYQDVLNTLVEDQL